MGERTMAGESATIGPERREQVQNEPRATSEGEAAGRGNEPEADADGMREVTYGFDGEDGFCALGRTRAWW